MIPPSAADHGSDDERDDGSNTEDRRRGLPMACSLLLLHRQFLLSVQPLLFLGKLLFSGNSSLLFFRCVTEQGMCLRGVHDEREHDEEDENKRFHGWK